MQSHNFARLHGSPRTVVINARLRGLSRATRKRHQTKQEGGRQAQENPVKGHCHSLGAGA
jgi:hypothetical protein